jgi:hypothetical protein
MTMTMTMRRWRRLGSRWDAVSQGLSRSSHGLQRCANSSSDMCIHHPASFALSSRLGIRPLYTVSRTTPYCTRALAPCSHHASRLLPRQLSYIQLPPPLRIPMAINARCMF